MSENRREFLKRSSAVGIAGAAALVSTQADSQQPTSKAVKINRNAKAILPDGSVKTRGEILQSLGLDPSTPPDAWLAIVGCGSNASALTTTTLKDLVSRGTIKKETLDKRTLQRLQNN